MLHHYLPLGVCSETLITTAVLSIHCASLLAARAPAREPAAWPPVQGSGRRGSPADSEGRRREVSGRNCGSAPERESVALSPLTGIRGPFYLLSPPSDIAPPLSCAHCDGPRGSRAERMHQLAGPTIPTKGRAASSSRHYTEKRSRSSVSLALIRSAP